MQGLYFFVIVLIYLNLNCDQVGDIVYVADNEMIPCDFVMLSSDDPDGNCSITTANLDGETNLKVMAMNTFYAKFCWDKIWHFCISLYLQMN